MVNGLETLEPFLSRNPELGAIFANGLPVGALDPRDVSNAVLWLASEEARYVTGAALTVDAGNTIR
jgi:NAD(P)-dependent dehydrogenase (short-subunit alcohol dehydrogenase family)